MTRYTILLRTAIWWPKVPEGVEQSWIQRSSSVVGFFVVVVHVLLILNVVFVLLILNMFFVDNYEC